MQKTAYPRVGVPTHFGGYSEQPWRGPHPHRRQYSSLESYTTYFSSCTIIDNFVFMFYHNIIHILFCLLFRQITNIDIKNSSFWSSCPVSYTHLTLPTIYSV